MPSSALTPRTTGIASSRRGREADLLEQRFEVVFRGRNAGEDPCRGLPNPRIGPRKRADRPAGAEKPLPRLVRLVAKSCRSDGASAARWICDMRAASSRASTRPEFMLCTPTGAAWCAASPASQTRPLPKLRVRRPVKDGVSRIRRRRAGATVR